jgi:hypothetical protein
VSFVFAFFLFVKNPVKRLLLVAIPVLTQLLILINYYNPKVEFTESYGYKVLNKNPYDGQTIGRPDVELENDVYGSYLLGDLIEEEPSVVNNNTVTFRFERGMLGMKVIRGYELSQDDERDALSP